MLKTGDTFERYTIEAAIGQGGMGCVYRAHDTRLGRRVALKVISDSATSAATAARLLREARAAAALDHPNAVAIFDVGELSGAPYIVMELVDGRTLRSVIGSGNEPVAVRTAWLTDVARALAAAHRRGLVHRDIKPENVMVREDGVVKVLDFGIARRAGGSVDPAASTQNPALPTLTIEGVRLGTPVYMAPEQIRGEALDGRADQFAWGVLAYELLTSRLPWRGEADAFAVIASILTDEVDAAAFDRAAVPPALQAIVLRALAKRPTDRFASMDDVVRALDAAARGEPPPAPRTSPPERAPAPKTPPPAAPAAQGAQSATLEQRYSTEEVREVLARAIEQQSHKRSDSRLGFDDLLAAAEEVGVDVESLREASRSLRMRKDESLPDQDELDRKDALLARRGERRAELIVDHHTWIRRKRRAFSRHALVFIIVNVAFFILGLMTGSLPWMLIPGLCWAIGLGIHGITALTANEDDWAEENQRMQWWLEQKRRRHEVALAKATGKGARAALKKGGPRQRIEATPGHARMRVAEETDERAAEEEAALAEESAPERAPARKRR